jgi:transcriptional regulator with PAS, ATPase and Fis domain
VFSRAQIIWHILCNHGLKKEKTSMTELIGRSELLLSAIETTRRAECMRILFWGETGTGKTPFARLSNLTLSEIRGHKRPFEQVNCAALGPEHFQDVMFGHKRGAFTGAISEKSGLVEIARGGDLFLDEIGDMPLSTQAHLLTFLDSQEYYRLGDDQKRKADVRILSATNRNLPQMIREGQFRLDLYSRLSQVIVEIPPLRDRRRDIPVLFEYFLKRYAGNKPYDPQVLLRLEKAEWKEGNVREFKDTIEYLSVMSREHNRIELFHLPERFYREPTTQEQEPLSEDVSLPLLYDVGLDEYVTRVEDRLLDRVIKSRHGQLNHLAADLKISRSTLYRRLRRIGVYP